MKNSISYKIRFALSIIWVIIGIALIVMVNIGIVDSDTWIGVGGGLIGVGIVQIIQKLRYNKDDEYKEKVDTEVSDERNAYIRMKAWSWTGYIFVIGSAVLSVIFLIAGNEAVSQILGLCTCAQILIYLIAYYVIKKKY